MDYVIQNRLELFADNAQIIKKEFAWQNGLTGKLAGLLYAQEGKAVDCEAIRQCQRRGVDGGSFNQHQEHHHRTASCYDCGDFRFLGGDDVGGNIVINNLSVDL